MAENNNNDMQRLQQDAIRRAREMQARAQINTVPINRPPPKVAVPIQETQPRPRPLAVPARQNEPNGNREAHEKREAHENHEPEEHRAANEHSPPIEKMQPKGMNPVGDIFEMLFKDSERTLILALILLLVEEKADTSLIFALMYLAM
jgi:hypothetical protein